MSSFLVITPLSPHCGQAQAAEQAKLQEKAMEDLNDVSSDSETPDYVGSVVDPEQILNAASYPLAVGNSNHSEVSRTHTQSISSCLCFPFFYAHFESEFFLFFFILKLFTF